VREPWPQHEAATTVEGAGEGADANMLALHEGGASMAPKPWGGVVRVPRRRRRQQSQQNIVTFNLAKIPLLFVWLTNDSSVSNLADKTNKVIGPFVN
jgi:hypothetical protein